MTNREDLRQALGNDNVRAFLRVIRQGESDHTGRAYRKLVGDPPGYYSLKSLHDHPHKVVTVKIQSPEGGILKVLSTAAGAYQFLGRTWDGLVAKYGFEDFSPGNQDEAAVALIAQRGVLEELKNGDIYAALDKCSYEWASLPPGRYSQPTLDEATAIEVYKRWGGHVLGEVPV